MLKSFYIERKKVLSVFFFHFVPIKKKTFKVFKEFQWESPFQLPRDESEINWKLEIFKWYGFSFSFFLHIIHLFPLFLLHFFILVYSTNCNSSKSKPMANSWTSISFWSGLWTSTLLSNASTRAATTWAYCIFPCEPGRFSYIPNIR